MPMVLPTKRREFVSGSCQTRKPSKVCPEHENGPKVVWARESEVITGALQAPAAPVASATRTRRASVCRPECSAGSVTEFWTAGKIKCGEQTLAANRTQTTHSAP